MQESDPQEAAREPDQPEAPTAPAGEGQFAFQAEVARLLHLMVHAVYSEKDVFLRELISNSADALDKLRYLANLEPGLLGHDTDLRVTLRADKEKRRLSVTDNGIGMTKAELIDTLGTIARSGTRAFIDQIATAGAKDDAKDGAKNDAKDGAKNDAKAALIGQFGVGFYSAFIVADRVEVWSRRAGTADAHLWVSDGINGFNVSSAPEQTESGMARGTVVTLHLKDEALEYTEEATIERIVRTYSDHVPFPIDLIVEKDGKNDKRQLNRGSALWTRPRADITEEQYREFYHDLAGPFDDPLLTIHYKAEGRHDYSVLLFVPAGKPFDLYEPNRKGRIKLYVRRVFITDDAELLPSYLRFMRGVVDSEDMPLNLSREMLQNNPIVASMRKALTNRVLSELGKLAEKEPAKFDDLWSNFGSVLKEGLYEDPERRDGLFAIARFRSTKASGWRSLKDYVADLRPNQTAIYYLVGENEEQIGASPQLEGFRARGLEVLLLTDPVDHFWVTSALGYEGKPFRSVSQGEAELSLVPLLEEAKTEDAATPEAAELIKALQAALGDAVGDVRPSVRLVDSPACLIAPQGGPDRGLGRLLARQGGGAETKPILEINLAHPLLQALASQAKAQPERLTDLAWLLLDEARLLEGELPADPAAFARRLNSVLVASLST